MNTKIDKRFLSAAAVGAALALTASAVLSRLSGASVALAAEQPQDGKPAVGLLSHAELLLRLERQMEETNKSLSEIKAQIKSGVPVRIIDPLPAGLRHPASETKPTTAPAEKPKPPADSKPADPQSSNPGHPTVHPSEPKSPPPGGPR